MAVPYSNPNLTPNPDRHLTLITLSLILNHNPNTNSVLNQPYA